MLLASSNSLNRGVLSWWSLRWGRPRTNCSTSREQRPRASENEAMALVEDLRSAHLRHGLALAGDAAGELEPLLHARFDWLQDLVRGLAIVRELSPRSSDAIASLGEQLSSLIVTFAFRNSGMPRGELRLARHHCYGRCVHARAADGGRDLPAPSGNGSPGRREEGCRDGWLHRIDLGRPDNNARTRRIGFFGVSDWCRARCRRDPDLDGRGRYVDGRSADHPGRPPSQKHILCGSRRNGLSSAPKCCILQRSFPRSRRTFLF